MENQLKKAIEIAKKTGDRLIVYDSAKSHPPYVIMSLDEYEKVTFKRSDVRGLTEDELLDKINRDIAIWKNEQKDSDFTETAKDFSLNQDIADNFGEPFDPGIPEFNEIEDNQAEERKRANLWRIPSTRKQGAEEVIEEDRQYLENIED